MGVIEGLDASGNSLHDVLSDPMDDPSAVMRCWLANLQVWGSIGNQRDSPGNVAASHSSSQQAGGVSDVEIECLLRKSDSAYSPYFQVSRRRLEELVRTVLPD